MALTKTRSRGINLADTFAFTGTVSGTGANTPAFIASRTSSNQTISANTWTKIQFNDEILDTDNMYDHSTNYRFTPTVAGKYYIYANIYSGTPNAHIYGSLHLNGNFLTIQVSDGSQGGGVFLANIITFNGSSDYVEAYTYHGTGNGTIEDSVQYAVWGGYKLIGV
tara:strand:+ start:536 stop:1033 length:498 start_codon:yes stop_codon:yes gene_type:complete